jgi:hypothetical protein
MVAVTTFYGYIGQERNLTEEQEYAKMEKFRADKEEPWAMVFGDRTTNHEAYGVNGIPHWVVLDRTGKVAFIHVGYSPEIFKPFREKVKALVEGTE